MPDKGVADGKHAPSEDAVRAELELILHRAAFRRSERQTRFLRFICEKALAGEGTKLNEYLIAHEVFDRGADYSPNEDSVVRRQAYSLRQKLQDYYVNEGRTDPVRIELPVGRYVPTFSFLQEPASPISIGSGIAAVLYPGPLETTERDRAIGAPRVDPRSVVIAIAASCLAAGLLLGWTAGRRTTSIEALDPAFREIWGRWLSDPQQTVICFSTPMSASIRQVEKPYAPNSIADRIAVTPGQSETEQLRKQLNLAPGGFLYLFPGLGHAKMGEALGSIKLTSMLTKANVPVRAAESRFLNWDDFRSENIILLGHNEANAWVDPILEKLPLRMATTTAEKPRRILNLHPMAGERSEYYPEYPDGTSQPVGDYALISFIGGVDGRHRLALVNGVNTEGTQMGLEYLTDPASLRYLVAALNRITRPAQGRHFQVVLHTELRDRTPTAVELVLLRIVP